MQRKTRLPKVIDRLLPAMAVLAVCFVFFAARLGNLLQALLLAVLVAALFLYALALFARSRQGKGRKVKMQRQLENERVLQRIAYDEALQRAFRGLQRAYDVRRIGTQQGAVYALHGGKTVFVGLSQAADELNVRDVQHFDRQRGELWAVLIACAPIAKSAESYAASLRPPLVIKRAAELELGLEHKQGQVLGKQSRKEKLGAVLKGALHPARSLGYMQAALFLLALYIVSGRMIYLVPGLGCALLGSLAKNQPQAQSSLFQLDF